MAAKGKGKGNDKIEKYRQLFKESDKDGDGYLSIQEFHKMLKHGGCNMSDSQIADTFVFFDGPQGDRRITFDEFTKGLDQIIAFVEGLRRLFEELDADGSGFLDKGELTALLQKCKRKYTDAEINEILHQADKNGDNQISFQEFMDACS